MNLDLAAWVREQGKKNPRRASALSNYEINTMSMGQLAAALRRKGLSQETRQAIQRRKNELKVMASYRKEADYDARKNPRHASVKLPRTGHTGFLKSKAVDVITRGGRVVEVRVKR